MELSPYGDNFIPVIPTEYTYHTEENPFCWDADCPCHSDKQAIEQVRHQYEEGLLTAQEVEDTLKGRVV